MPSATKRLFSSVFDVKCAQLSHHPLLLMAPLPPRPHYYFLQPAREIIYQNRLQSVESEIHSK